MSLLKMGREVLGVQKLAELDKILGLDPENDRLIPQRLHLWKARDPLKQLPWILKWAFPAGAEVAAAEWSRAEFTLTKLAERIRMYIEVAVVRHLDTAVLVRTDPGLAPDLTKLDVDLTWRLGSKKNTLRITPGQEPLWRMGQPTWADLELAWPASPSLHGMDDLASDLIAEGFDQRQIERIIGLLSRRNS